MLPTKPFRPAPMGWGRHPENRHPRAAYRIALALCLLGLSLRAQPTAASPADPANDGTAQTLALAIPMTARPGHPQGRITVRLEKSVNAEFLVDTGSGFMAISQSLARKLALKPHPATGRDGKPFSLLGKQANAVAPNSLQFPEATTTGIMPDLSGDMIVLPDVLLLMPPALDKPHEVGTYSGGIIGASLLRNFAVVFDFAGHTLTLYYPGSFSERQARLVGCLGPGGTSLRLTQADPDSDRFSVQVRLTNGSVSRDVSLDVDTGSEDTSISPDVAQALHLRSTGQKRQYGMEGIFHAAEAQVPTLDIGELRLTNVQVTYPDNSDFSSLLGLNVLTGYKVLMDFPGGKMYLQPATVPPAVTVGPAVKPEATTTPETKTPQPQGGPKL